jgi:hypothetical protein
MVNRIKRDMIDSLLLGGSNRVRVTCPNCGNKDLLTITRTEDAIVYNCFSNSCNTRGAHPYLADFTSLKNKMSLKSDSKGATAHVGGFRLPTYLVEGIATERVLEWLTKYNAIKAYEMGYYTLYTDVRSERVCVPLYNEYNILTNMIGRSYVGAKPKSKVYNYGHNVPPFICGNGDKVVIVEDFASACNVSTVPNHVGFSLNGTNFDVTHMIRRLNMLKPKEIVVALDKDALLKGMNLCRLINSFSSNVKVAPLLRDLKDEPNINEVLK